MKVIFRDIIEKARKYIKTDEILIFTGPRQAGKTTILKLIQEELTNKGEKTYYLNLEDPDFLSLLNRNPKNLFKIFPIDSKIKNFIFIDEIQYLNNPTNFLKFLFDEYKGRIKLIVSGSSAFYLDKKFKDSLAGRKILFNVRTLSFREFLRFQGEDELSRVLPAEFSPENYKYGKKISLIEQDRLKALFFEFLIYGGYPRVVLAPISDRIRILEDIAYSYIKKDMFEANIRQDEIFYRLFKLLASQIGGLVNTNELANTLGVSRKAIDNYLYVMQKSFHILLLRPFYNNIRKELTRMPKVYFYDIGLRNFFVNNFESILLRSDRGVLLENAVARQLLERVDLPEEKLRYWRSKTGAEVDFIFDGKIAFEVKFDTNIFKKSKYRLFLENYPHINLNIVSVSGEALPGYRVWNPCFL